MIWSASPSGICQCCSLASSTHLPDPGLLGTEVQLTPILKEMFWWIGWTLSRGRIRALQGVGFTEHFSGPLPILSVLPLFLAPVPFKTPNLWRVNWPVFKVQYYEFLNSWPRAFLMQQYEIPGWTHSNKSEAIHAQAQSVRYLTPEWLPSYNGRQNSTGKCFSLSFLKFTVLRNMSVSSNGPRGLSISDQQWWPPQ